MTNNPTIDGVSPPVNCRQRMAAEGKPYPRSSCEVCGQFSPKWRECDALLAAPAVERKEVVAPFHISVDDWNLLVRGDVEIADVRVSRTRRSKFTEPLFSHPPALQSTIAKLEDKLNKAIDLDFERRETIDQLQARIAELESGLGKIAGFRYRANGDWEWVDESPFADGRTHYKLGGEELQLLYTTQPAPVSVVHPFAEKVINKLRRCEECFSDFDSDGIDIGRHWLDLLTQLGLLNRVQRSPAIWEITQQGEDCLDATAALNGVKK